MTKKITIQKVEIFAFRQLRNFVYSPGEVNVLTGRNEVGKTNAASAISWVFTGNDLYLRENDDVRPREEGLFDEDSYADVRVTFFSPESGEVATARRILKQKFSGKGAKRKATNVTEYEFNDNPVSTAKQFEEYLNHFFPVKYFFLLSNPLFFGNDWGTRWSYKDRRAFLMSLTGEVTTDQILQLEPDLESFIPKLKEADIKNIAKRANKDKADAERRLTEIKGAIENIMSNMINEEDTEEIKAEKKQLEEERTRLTLSFADAKNETISDLKSKLSDAEVAVMQKKQTATAAYYKSLEALNEAYTSIKRQKSDLEDDRRRKVLDISTKNLEIEKLESRRTELLLKFSEEESKEMEPISDTCSACNRPFDTQSLMYVTANKQAEHKEAIAKILTSIREEGVNIRKQIDSIVAEKTKLQQSIETIDAQLKAIDERLIKEKKAIEEHGDLETAIANDPEIKALQLRSSEIKSSIERLETEDEKAERERILNKINSINEQILLLDRKIQQQEKRKESKKQLEEYQAEIRATNKKLSSAELLRDQCVLYLNTQNAILESQASQHFENVTFKLFEPRLDPESEPKQICDVYKDGTKWDSLSYGAKTTAGLYLIQGFSRLLEYALPVFVDNKESVNIIPKLESQLFYLVCDENVNKLTFKTIQ